MGQLSLKKPSEEAVRRFLDSQVGLGFTYTDVGATAGTPPRNFVVDHTSVELGTGEETFLAAQEALRNWRQFQLGWVDPCPADTPLEVGEVVAVLGWALGIWFTNAARIIYTVDEFDTTRRFGFAYGTLPGHVERGEERFLIEWDRVTDKVTYDILAFSRPNHLLTRIGYPLVRFSQKRFGRESAAAMVDAVGNASLMPTVHQATA